MLGATAPYPAPPLRSGAGAPSPFASLRGTNFRIPTSDFRRFDPVGAVPERSGGGR